MKIALVILIVLEIVLAALTLPPRRATYHYYTTKEVRGPDQPPKIEKIDEGSGEIRPIRAALGFWVLLTINTAVLVVASVRLWRKTKSA